MMPETCGWSLPHRDKHLCSCVCVLAKGHDRRHACTTDFMDWAAEGLHRRAIDTKVPHA